MSLFIIEGKGIAKGRKVSGDFSIMDIGLTVCYLLGVAYPKHSKGRVLLEAINEIDSKKLRRRSPACLTKYITIWKQISMMIFTRNYGG